MLAVQDYSASSQSFLQGGQNESVRLILAEGFGQEVESARSDCLDRRFDGLKANDFGKTDPAVRDLISLFRISPTNRTFAPKHLMLQIALTGKRPNDGRYLDHESSAPSRIVIGLEGSLVVLDDPVAHRQSQPGPLWLCSVERFENPP